jgi:ANTAR domain/GAF domain
VLTSRSVELLDVSAAGLLLADPRGELRVVAASSEAARLLELFQLQSDQGPCLDCFRSGQPVACIDLSADPRWPQFARQAGQAGFSAVQALPMRLRDQVISALNLFRGTVGAFDPEVVHVGQALADVATISLLHDRSMRRTDTLNEQLQTALNSRVVIEQAKGKLAERLGIDVNQAFTLLRDQARNRNHRLSDLAQPSSTAPRPSPAPPAAAPEPATPTPAPPAQDRPDPRPRLKARPRRRSTGRPNRHAELLGPHRRRRTPRASAQRQPGRRGIARDSRDPASGKRKVRLFLASP